jgi:hypothetical protein
MARRKKPELKVVHHIYGPPVYTLSELDGLKEQATRLAKHIEILEEEVRNMRSQLIGLETIILENNSES